MGALKVTSLTPYHGDAIQAFMGRCREILIPELNYQGQLANLISHLHEGRVRRFARANGAPLAPSTIRAEIEGILKEGGR